MTDGDMARGQVGNHFGNEEWRYLARAAIEVGSMGGFDRFNAAQAHADDHAGAWRLCGIDFVSAVLHRYLSRGETILNKEIHLFDLFGLDKILGLKIRNLTGDAGGERFQMRGWIVSPPALTGMGLSPTFFIS